MVLKEVQALGETRARSLKGSEEIIGHYISAAKNEGFYRTNKICMPLCVNTLEDRVKGSQRGKGAVGMRWADGEPNNSITRGCEYAM